MGRVARAIGLAVVVTTGCTGSEPEPRCTDGVKHVAVDEPLAALGGETPLERFERVAKAWDCTVTWLALPESIAVQAPAPGTSRLALSLERTSDKARYREYAQTRDEKWEGYGCQQDAVLVPCRLGLSSDDGALDETLDCELRLQGENTYVHEVVAEYAFHGVHTTSFVEGVEPAGVEFSVVYTPFGDPTGVNGSIVEAGDRERGVDPLVTTAVIECRRPEGDSLAKNR